MKWPNILGYGILMDAAGDDGAAGGGGDKGGDEGNKSTKIKLGTKEYDPADLESAISLFNALRDPETGTEIIETLAKKAGILDKGGEPQGTKKEAEKKLTGRVTKYFKDKLGKDYEKFSDMVGPIIDQAIEEMFEEHKGELNSKSAANKWDGEVNKFTETHVLTEEIEDTMKELMEEAPPNLNSKTFNPQRYLKRMYKAALDELDIEAPEPEEKPRKFRKTRVTEDDDDVPTITTRDRPKNLTLDDAIDAAVKGIRFRSR